MFFLKKEILLGVKVHPTIPCPQKAKAGGLHAASEPRGQEEQLSSTAFVQCVRGPGFKPQYQGGEGGGREAESVLWMEIIYSGIHRTSLFT